MSFEFLLIADVEIHKATSLGPPASFLQRGNERPTSDTASVAGLSPCDHWLGITFFLWEQTEPSREAHQCSGETASLLGSFQQCSCKEQSMNVSGSTAGDSLHGTGKGPRRRAVTATFSKHDAAKSHKKVKLGAGHMLHFQVQLLHLT